MSDNLSFPTLQGLSTELARLTTQAGNSVVAVHSHHSQSSGFVWRPSLIVTADEALADEGEVMIILPGGETAAATVAGRDPTTDIALLRVARPDLNPAALDGGRVETGSLAIAVGAQGGAATAALGTVAISGHSWRSLRGGEIDARIELDLSLRRQAEGGLAIGSSGRPFGLVVFGPRQRVLVIPAATIERVAARLETHGRIPRGYLGLGLKSVKLDSEGQAGLMAMSVDADGPAAAAGILQGDVVVGWNGETVGGVRALLRALGPDSVGSSLTLSIRRGGKPAEVSLVIGERPV